MEDETSIENINDIGKISNFLQNEAELLYLQVLVIVLLQYSQLFLKSMQWVLTLLSVLHKEQV